MSTNRKGAIAETAITYAALSAGIDVYRPASEGGRFDLIFVLPGGRMSRVQCKWANLVRGAVAIRLFSKAGQRVVHLRTRQARNGQRKRLHFAEQYRLGAIAQLGERLAGSQKVAGSSPASSIA
jgi:PD-(D/E)XK nuclease superfamily protein